MKLISRLFLSLLVLSPMAQADKLPNFIVIFCDDLGYGDLGVYGSEKNRTPNLDQMAKEGMRFTDFYSSSPVCTPSRASLLTGCYPRRIGLHEAETQHWVLIPRNKRGLHPDEITVAELLKTKGYATACIGKWHLGDQPEHLPTEHGFDPVHPDGFPVPCFAVREESGSVYVDIEDVVNARNISFRTAAYVVAIEKICVAYNELGIFP